MAASLYTTYQATVEGRPKTELHGKLLNCKYMHKETTTAFFYYF